MIDEQCLHSGGIYADKRLALWRLEESCRFLGGAFGAGRIDLQAAIRY
jgi:hypothetical protein